MAIQTFWESTSAVEFPQFAYAGAQRDALLCTAIHYVAAIDSIIGVFMWGRETHPRVGTFNNIAQMQKIWRAGELTVVGGNDVPQFGQKTGRPLWYGGIVPTTDGRMLYSPLLAGAFKNYFNFVIEDGHSVGVSLFTGAAGWITYNGNYYEVQGLWPGDIKIPGAIVDAAVMKPNAIGMVNPSTKVGYSVSATFTDMSIISNIIDPNGTSTVVSSLLFGPVTTNGGGADTSYQLPRGIHHVDASTVIVTFGIPGGPLGSTNVSQPGIIRVFDTKVNTGVWTLLWEDELPGKSQAATYDPINQVLYSIGLHASTSIMYASKLKRTPTIVASASIRPSTQTELVPLNTAVLSTFVQHGSGTVGTHGTNSLVSTLSGELVQWTLDPADSGGSLASAYSLTDENGIATITYQGGVTPDSGLTERVNVTTATIAKC
jgi:hypothetical protein